MDSALMTALIFSLIYVFIVFQSFKYLLKKIVAPLKTKKSKTFLSGLYSAIGFGVFVVITFLLMFINNQFGSNTLIPNGLIEGVTFGFLPIWIIFLFLYYNMTFEYEYLGKKREHYSSLGNAILGKESKKK